MFFLGGRMFFLGCRVFFLGSRALREPMGPGARGPKLVPTSRELNFLQDDGIFMPISFIWTPFMKRSVF